jgi:N-acetylmuramoyl-L-alanine amidase
VIALDPGHNGANAAHPGEVNRLVDAGGFQKACNTVGASTDAGYPESRFNMEVALLLRSRLEAEGAQVHLTRPDDLGVGPCIDERGAFGGSVGADVLVSIHADGAPADGHGFHVIRPAVVVGYTEPIVDPSAVLASAIRDALSAAGMQPSTYTGTDGIDVRGDLGTLNRSAVPAVIVEAGNLRNPGDAQKLTSTEGQARLADGLAAGIVAFLSR